VELVQIDLNTMPSTVVARGKSAAVNEQIAICGRPQKIEVRNAPIISIVYARCDVTGRHDAGIR
jgi:hypothetical protein